MTPEPGQIVDLYVSINKNPYNETKKQKTLHLLRHRKMDSGFSSRSFLLLEWSTIY